MHVKAPGFADEVDSRPDFVHPGRVGGHQPFFLQTHLEELTNAELDLSSTNFTFAPRAETGVFSATCPIDPYAGGFRGVCGKAPLDREVTQRAWHLMARTEDALCRHLLQQTLCSYMFNSSGSCVPPYSLEEDDGREDFSEVTFGHYSFPKRGERPPKLREKLLELKGIMQDHNS